MTPVKGQETIEEAVEACPGCCVPRQVAFTRTSGNVTVREFQGIDCDGADVMEGFPSLGFVSTIAASHLIDTLKLPFIGTISSPLFPPTCLIRNGQPAHPVRIHGDRRLVVFICEFKLPAETIHGLVEVLLDFARRHSSRRIFTVEGLPIKNPGDKNAIPVHFLSMERPICEKLVKNGLVPVKDGIVSGVTGVLLAESSVWQAKVTCLLAPASASHPDARSAVNIIRIIDNLLEEIEVDLVPLEEQARKMEEAIKASQESGAEAVKAHAAHSTSMYG